MERLVVRLIGDGSLYKSMLTEAQVMTQQVASGVMTAAKQIEAIGQNLKTFGHTVVGVLAGFGLTTSIEGAIKRYSEFEKGVVRLRVMMEDSGADVEKQTARYLEFAGQLAKTTMQSKGSAMALIGQAEAMGKHGQAAEDVVKIAVALGALNQTDAASQMNTAKLIQSGNLEYAKRALHLREVKDGTELQKAVQDKLRLGMKLANEETKTFDGRVEKLKKSLGGLTNVMGKIATDIIGPVVSILAGAIAQFNKLDPVVHKVTAAIIGVFLSFGVFLSGLKLAIMLSGVFHVKQIASLLLWGLWKAAVLAATLVIGFWKIAVAVATFILTGHMSALGIWSGVILIAKAVTWLWNAALTVLNALLAPVTIIAATVAVVALAVAFVVVASIAWGLYKAGEALFNLFKEFPAASPGLKLIGDMFREWWTILKDVFTVAQTNLPLAWKYLVAGFRLAVSQMKTQWEPLWGFIREGFSVSWRLVWAEFQLHFANALGTMMLKLMNFFRVLPGGDALAESLGLALKESVNAGATGAFEKAKADLSNLVANFKPGVESDETKAARAELEKLQPAIEKAKNDAMKPPEVPDIGAPYKKATSEIHKFDAAVTGSAEAVARIQEFTDKMQYGEGKDHGGGGGKGNMKFDVANAGGAEANGRTEEQVALLRDIRDDGRKLRPRTVVIEGADVST